MGVTQVTIKEKLVILCKFFKLKVAYLADAAEEILVDKVRRNAAAKEAAKLAKEA